jgi:hypothetical protein
MRNDLQVQLRVLDVHHDFPCILVDLLKRTPQGLGQRNQRPDDAGHPDVRQQDVLAKVSKHTVPADAERVGVLFHQNVGQLRAAQNTTQTLKLIHCHGHGHGKFMKTLITSFRTSCLIWSAMIAGSMIPALRETNSAMRLAIFEFENVHSQHLETRTDPAAALR